MTRVLVKYWIDMSDFETVKQQIDLADILRREHSGGQVNKAGRSWRCNPCPLCGHNDCFTFTSKRFHCFSCEEKGDVVDFIQKARHVTNVEALRYLSNIIGIPLSGGLAHPKGESEPYRRADNGRASHDKIPQGAGRTDEAQRTEAIVEDEKRVELCRLRRITADFYHGQLLNNADALRYQIETRRHSRAILEACLVGFTAGSLICHIAQQGADPTSLVETGLVKPAGRVLKEYLPRNCYVYPHFAGERVLYFTCKDPTGRMKYQIPKRRELSNGAAMPLPDPAWICYGQDALERDGCFLVEGENDRLSVLDAGEPHVAATIGNFCTPEVTAWLTHNAGGRTYYLCFDSDSAGEKYTDHYAKVILNAGGKVRVIRL